MKVFQKLTMALLLVSLNSWMSSAHAYYDGQSELGVDGSNNTVAVWRVKESNIFKLQGTYDTGAPWDINDITNVNEEDVVDYPVLAVSKDPSATTKAAVVWLSRNISNSRRNLKVSTYTTITNSWTTPQIISSDPPDPNEFVRSDYQVAISDDGLYISVIWTSLFTNTNQNSLRSAVSNDGGNSWTNTQITNLGPIY